VIFERAVQAKKEENKTENKQMQTWREDGERLLTLLELRTVYMYRKCESPAWEWGCTCNSFSCCSGSRTIRPQTNSRTGKFADYSRLDSL